MGHSPKNEDDQPKLSDAELDSMLAEAPELSEENKERIKENKDDLWAHALGCSRGEVSGARSGMEKLIKKIEQVQGSPSDFNPSKVSGSWIAWAKRILARSIIDDERQISPVNLTKKSKHSISSKRFDIDSLIDRGFSADEQAERNELLAIIKQKIQELPEGQRSLIVRVYYYKQTLKSFQEPRGMTYAQARALEKKALDNLKRTLGPHFPERNKS